MPQLQDVIPEYLARETGIPLEVIQIFVRAATSCQQSAPLKVIWHNGQPTLSVTFPGGNIGGENLSLTQHPGVITIDAGGGCPGEQYCYIAIAEYIMGEAALGQLRLPGAKIETIKMDDLERILGERLQPLHDRLSPQPPRHRRSDWLRNLLRPGHRPA